MSFGFLGIQFGWGLQMANMSAIYKYLGANAEQARDSLARRADHRRDHPAAHRPIQRPALDASGPSAAVYSGRRNSGVARADFDAQLSAVWMAAGLLWVLDGTINASHAAVSRACRRQIAGGTKHAGLRHPVLVHRSGRHRRLGLAVDDDQLVWRRSRQRRRPHPAIRPAVVLHRRGGVSGRGAVDGLPHLGISAVRCRAEGNPRAEI